MKKQTDWKALGHLLSVVVNLFALIRDTFAKMGVGIELLPWIIGEGKENFVKEFLQPLGQKFLASTQPKKPRVLRTLVVDLSATPKLPFQGATVEVHAGGARVKLQKRKDGLYVDGVKVVLYLSERQKNGKSLRGHELREELTGTPVLNANILDALLEHPEMFPEDWKQDEQGDIRYIFFWGSIFRDSDDRLCVQYGCFYDGQWFANHFWLDYNWHSGRPAASLAS